MLAYLRELGVVAPLEPNTDQSAQQRLLSAYERYLTDERGLRPSTVVKYLHIATMFLAAISDPRTETLSVLSAEQVTGFICAKGAGAKSIADGLRPSSKPGSPSAGALASPTAAIVGILDAWLSTRTDPAATCRRRRCGPAA